MTRRPSFMDGVSSLGITRPFVGNQAKTLDGRFRSAAEPALASRTTSPAKSETTRLSDTRTAIGHFQTGVAAPPPPPRIPAQQVGRDDGGNELMFVADEAARHHD